MAIARAIPALVLAIVLPASAVSVNEQTAANPIRKVVTMLQMLEKKVQAEGETEKELFDKFMCYCKTGAGTLGKSIADAEAKVPQVTSDIEESESKLKQDKEDLKQAQTDRAAAKSAMAEATTIREKEAAAFASEKAEYTANLEAMKKATAAIEKGMTGFLQTPTAQYLRNFVLNKQNLADYDRETLVSFLSGTQTGGYAPASGEITGILKEMTDTMSKALADAEAAEASSISSFGELMAAKTKEVEALTKTIETKTVRIGELSVAIVEMKEDLDDTGKQLLEDKKFLADMDKTCATKTAEHENNMKLRGEELLALADTIKLLNDDDALELFKKTLPGASSSFVQMEVSEASQQQQALALIREAKRSLRKPSTGLDFLALAVQGKKINFGKVLKMIDEMVAVLKKEQLDDNDKKEYCEKQFDFSDDKKKGLERTVSDLETSISKAEESLSVLASEIKALEEGIKDLDKSVAEATEQRKEENKDFTELMASDTAAKELLGLAKNRLNKFYNPKMYKAPPKAVLADVSVHSFVAPPPPPETAAAYSKKSEESTGVIAMIDLLVKDLDKEMTVAETEEKDAQSDYEQAMKDSAEKRALDSKTLTDKSGAKAETEAALESYKEQKGATTKELMATLSYISSLHGECDWLIQYFDVRKEARDGEIDSLKTAKSVLSGADFSLLQQSRSLRGSA